MKPRSHTPSHQPDAVGLQFACDIMNSYKTCTRRVWTGSGSSLWPTKSMLMATYEAKLPLPLLDMGRTHDYETAGETDLLV